MNFSDRTIEEIKARLSIVDVVADYCQVINRGGGAFWIRCPFHGSGNERTPSCKLNLERGSFYCFACHEHGSMFSFVMKMERVSFPEAVRMLAAKAGVTLEEESPQDVKRKEEKNSLFELNEEMCSAFHNMLLSSPEAQKARDYLASRKVSMETIGRFRLGYAPRDTKWLHGYISGLGYTDDFLMDSGFFSKRKFPYPLFAERLMFPVRNWQGKVVAFGGRDLSFREDAPKYLNTPETSVYSKKHNLYALYEGLDAIRESHEVIICEGNFDAVSLHQAGLRNAVAPFGTAFTAEQAALIGRYAERVRLLFDSDGAGREATAKAIVLLQERGLEASVLSLDKHKDASEYLEKEGPEALRQCLTRSTEAFKYLVTKGLDDYNIRTPKGKSDFIQGMASFLNATGSDVEREAYVRQLSELVGVGEERVEADLRRSASQVAGHMPARLEERKGADLQPLRPSAISPDLYMMLIFANHRELFAAYTKAFRFGDLKDREAQLIYLALENVRRDGIGKTDEIFLSLLADDQVRHDVAMSFELDEFKMANPQSVIDEILDRIALRRKEEDRRLILMQIQQGEAEGLTDDDLKELLNEKIGVDSEIRELKERLGRPGRKFTAND